MEQDDDIEFIGRREVERLCGVSTSSLYRGIAAGSFPQPVKSGPRTSRWIRAEVLAWRNARIAERGSAQRDEALQ